MSAVTLLLLDGSSVSVEATRCGTTIQVPAALFAAIRGMSGASAATWVPVDGRIYVVQGTKVATDAIIAAGTPTPGTATPLAVAAAGVVGVAVGYSREDHVHPHGAQTDATMHAVASASAHGFMAKTDKSRLDAIVFGNEHQTTYNAGSTGTTSASQQLIDTLTTPALVGGTYRIEWCSELGAIETSARVWASVYIDDVVACSIYVPTDNVETSAAFFQVFSGFTDIALSAGVHTVKLYLARQGGAGTETVYMQRRKLSIYRTV